MKSEMKPIDTLGIPVHNSSPTDVTRIADEIRDWLNERYERGYRFLCIASCPYSTIIVVERQEHDPQEHGD